MGYDKNDWFWMKMAVFDENDRFWWFSPEKSKIEPDPCKTRKNPKNDAVKMNTKKSIFHFPRGYPGKFSIFGQKVDFSLFFGDFLMFFIKNWSKSWFWGSKPLWGLWGQPIAPYRPGTGPFWGQNDQKTTKIGVKKWSKSRFLAPNVRTFRGQKPRQSL